MYNSVLKIWENLIQSKLNKYTFFQGIFCFSIAFKGNMKTSLTASNKSVQKWVLCSSGLYLTIQFIGLAATVVFYMLATHQDYRDKISKYVHTALYTREDWPYLRQEQILQVTRPWFRYRLLKTRQILPDREWYSFKRRI